jgi:hypothetical protein
VKLLDTSVVVDHLRGYAPATALLVDLVEVGETVAGSELTRFELLAGVRPRELDDLEAFFAAIEWVPVTEEVARLAGGYARSYRGSHQGIGVVDCLVAGTATALGAELVTMNVRHFPMFNALQPPYRYSTGPASSPSA